MQICNPYLTSSVIIKIQYRKYNILERKDDGNMKKLDKSFFEKPRQSITAKEALKDITKIKWSDAVLNGEKKLLFTADCKKDKICRG